MQCSGLFQQHRYPIAIAHKGPKSFLDAIPFTLLKEHHSWIWLILSVNWSLLPEMQLLKGDVSTAFSPLWNIFFSIIMDHGIYHQEAVPIFLSDVTQAGQSLQEHSVTGKWLGRSMAWSTWEIQAGPFKLLPVSEKERSNQMGQMWFVFCLCDVVGWRNSTWPFCEALISRLERQSSSREEVLLDQLPETWGG